METTNIPLKDFIDLSDQLIDNISIVSENNQIKNYCKICKKFIIKYPENYLEMYKKYIYIKSKNIKDNDYSILNNYKNWTVKNPNININKTDMDSIFHLLFTSFDTLTADNKKAIFMYLQYMNEIIEKYNL